jgi:hypothetical protein
MRGTDGALINLATLLVVAAVTGGIALLSLQGGSDEPAADVTAPGATQPQAATQAQAEFVSPQDELRGQTARVVFATPAGPATPCAPRGRRRRSAPTSTTRAHG